MIQLLGGVDRDLLAVLAQTLENGQHRRPLGKKRVSSVPMPTFLPG